MARAFLIGRILVGAYYLNNSYHHFSNTSHMAQNAAAHGVPFPTAAILMAGVLLAIAGVTFLLGVMPRLGVVALAAFLLPVSFVMHPFWAESGALKMADMTNFTKNLALLGSGLMFLAVPEPWPYSVASRLQFRRYAPASRRA